MTEFDCEAFTSTAALVCGHLDFLRETVLTPFMQRMQPIIVALRAEAKQLTYSFLQREPVPLAHPTSQTDYYALSKKRDVAASLRRYALGGSQTRGLHLRMREAVTKEQHLHFAKLFANVI